MCGMNVLLISPPDRLERVLGKGKVFSPHNEPYGLLYMAAVLEQAGYQVGIYDAALAGHSVDEALEVVLRVKPDLVGISVLTATGVTSYHLGQGIRKRLPHTPIVMGNIHASVFDRLYLVNEACDIVVHGEGEYILRQIVKEMASGHPNLQHIPGISFLSGGQLIRTAGTGCVEQLDDLPLPARHLVNFRRYTSFHSRRSVFTLFTSRSCIFKCKFCVVNQNRYRMLSVDRVLEEMLFLLKKYPDVGRKFFIADPLFTGSSTRVRELCEAVLKRDLRIEMQCEAHANTVDADLLRLLKRAGLKKISIGFESGNNRILKKIGKKTTIKRLRRVSDLIHRAGIRQQGLFVLGFPDDTIKTVNQTVEFALSLPLNSAQFSIFCPYPGSAYHDEIMRRPAGIRDALNDWERYTSYPAFGGSSPIYAPPGIPVETLVQLQKSALKRFYFRPRTLLTPEYVLSRINRQNFYQIIQASLSLFRSS